MELVEGSSLADFVSTPLPEARLFALFAEAGRGLAAVHGLGIVHRDFKPANVFVGHDDRVCIGDFGLAIASDDDSSADRPSGRGHERTPLPALLDVAITEQGTVPGTPAYMAPEQLFNEPLDARCDQYAFAVALWMALYRERPFPKDAVKLPRKPPPRPRTASWSGRAVESVLRRALSHRREDRFADMPSLLSTLERARLRPRRLALSASALVLLSATAAVALPRLLQADPCGVRARAAAAFPPSMRGRLKAAVATPNPLSDIGAHVDAYTAQWVSAADSTCSRDDFVDRPAVQACLDRRLGDLTALAAVLAAHPEAVEAALPAVIALPTPQSCLNARQASDGKTPNEQQRTLERRLSDARAAWLAGRASDALGLASGIVAAAQATLDPQLEAEASYLVGVSAADLGDLPGAERALRQAIAGAMGTRSEHLEASAWVELLNVVGDRGRRYDEALTVLTLERGAVARVPEDLDVRTRAAFVEAVMYGDRGELDLARPLAFSAIALSEQRVPRDPRMVSRAHGTAGNLLASSGQVDQGLAQLLAARRALEGALPAGHISFAPVANNLGVLQQRRGDRVAARASYEASIAILEGTKNPMLGVPLDNLAGLEREEGHLPQARALYERARGIAVERFGPTHERTINSVLGLGLLLQDEGRFADAQARLDEAVAALHATNPHGRPTLEALLARALLAFERGDGAAELAARLDEVRVALTPSDDVRNVRAELALVDAVRALQAGEVERAGTLLEVARANAQFVKWAGFDAVLAGWTAVAQGRPPDCAHVPRQVVLARTLVKRCSAR
jgi:tetratricopeptide (TPR) repeat protein